MGIHFVHISGLPGFPHVFAPWVKAKGESCSKEQCNPTTTHGYVCVIVSTKSSISQLECNAIFILRVLNTLYYSHMFDVLE